MMATLVQNMAAVPVTSMVVEAGESCKMIQVRDDPPLLNSLGLTKISDTSHDMTNIEELKTDQNEDQKPTKCDSDQTKALKEVEWAERPANHPIIYMKKMDTSLSVEFSTNAGQMIFKKAIRKKYMNIYFTLAPHFHTQCETNLCGSGTLTMVLNALKVDPRRMWKYPWRWYDEYMINCCLSVEEMMGGGIGFDGLACTMRCNKLSVETVRASQLSSLEEFRRDIKSSASSNDVVMILSYGRGTFNQTGSGHYSPMGGYNKMLDMVLIFDTARFKFPPQWVKLSTLWKAMKAIAVGQKGNTDNMPRGYFMVKKNEAKPTITLKLPGDLRLKIDPAKKGEKIKLLQSTLTQWDQWLDNKNSNINFLQNTIAKLADAATNRMSELELKEHTVLQNISKLPLKQIQSTKTYRKIDQYLQKIATKECFALHSLLADIWSSVEKNRSPVKANWKMRLLRAKDKLYEIKHDHQGTTLSHSLTALILFWPYRATDKNSNRMQLQRFVSEDLESFDSSFLSTIHEQTRFIMKTLSHLGHEDVYRAEEHYFD